MTDTELKMPERIWAQWHDEAVLVEHPPTGSAPISSTEYIRADLATRPAPSAQVEGDVKSAFDKWWAGAMRGGSTSMEVPSYRDTFEAGARAAQLPKVEEVTVEEAFDLAHAAYRKQNEVLCFKADIVKMVINALAGLKIIPTQEK